VIFSAPFMEKKVLGNLHHILYVVDKKLLNLETNKRARGFSEFTLAWLGLAWLGVFKWLKSVKLYVYPTSLRALL